MTIRKDLSGKRFNRWLILSFDELRTDRVYYKCQCDCGTTKSVLSQNLIKGISKSCGCLKIANVTSRKRTDPKRVTAHKVWKARYSDGCSFETFLKLSQKNCHYCGVTPSNYCNAYTGNNPIIKRSPDWVKLCNFTYNGLDRLDSSKNHAEDNIVSCCVTCNKAKNDMSLDEFKVWLNKIYNHFIIGENNVVSSGVSKNQIIQGVT